MIDLINDSLLKLKKNKFTNAELDLKILLEKASYESKEIILSNFDIKNINIDYFKILLNKRLKNEPIAKIIGKKYFWKNEFFVNKYVLDPRPETEIIIEEVLTNIKNNNDEISILDIGTGSGCIAISLALEIPNSRITAIDISSEALKVAKKNIDKYNLNNQIDLKLIDFRDVKKKFDFVVSNPPYIKETEYEDLQLEIKNYEPKVALVAGIDGMKFYKIYASVIEKLMNKNSLFICEIGDKQLNSCIKIFAKSNLKLKKITKDIQKIDRTLTFFKI